MMTLRSILGFSLLWLPVLASAEITLEVHDDRLQVSLMVEAPDLRTPIGIAVDLEDRIYVAESHTYLRPSDYDGPQSDRIKLIQDLDHDGKPEQISTAYEGLREVMNLSVSPNGILYAACASEIVALLDHNDDGMFDTKQTIVTLETDYGHPHYRLNGITFSDDGWLYFSRGNMGGYAYIVRGSDGSAVSGYGDGGSILRCLPGGKQLEQVATGFWNVFGMDRDGEGRLLAVDNDPEARGPNRLLHIVSGGDYGYKTLHGKSGHHPMLSWNGELPGTLPMVSATREAPAGLLACRRSSLPAEFADSLLVACWGESVIERHALQPYELSVGADASVLVSGPQEFRPVAMAANSKGTIFITDWADSGYSNHRKGRLWRLSTKETSDTDLKPSATLSKPQSDAQKVLEEIASKRNASDAPQLFQLFLNDDPFLAHAAVESLSRPVFWKRLVEASNDTTAAIRLGALLSLRKAAHPDATNLVVIFLSDPNSIIRQAALRWAVELRKPQLRPALGDAVISPKVSSALFETYLAAMSHLEPAFLDRLASRSTGSAFDLSLSREDRGLEAVIASEATNDHLRALALMRLGVTENRDVLGILSHWAAEKNPPLQIAAIRGLARIRDARESVIALLKPMTSSRLQDVQVRAEAISALVQQDPGNVEWALPLLDDHRGVVRLEAARALRSAGHLASVRPTMEQHYESILDKPSEQALAEQLEMALYGLDMEKGKFSRQRPKTLAEWQERLSSGGDVQGGRRLFHSQGLLCSLCHTPGTFRNSLGPSLENLGQSVDRARIIQSILKPSTNASPAYQAWTLTTKDGRSHQGVQLEWMIDGTLKYIAFEGDQIIVPADEVVSFTPLPNSIMPSGLEHHLTVEELRELVSYLELLGSTLD